MKRVNHGTTGRGAMPTRDGSVVLGFLALVASLIAAVVLAVVGMLRMDRDAAVLRDTVVAATGGGWEKQVQLGVGRLPLWVARQAARHAELEPEVGAVLETVRGVHVGVFQRTAGGGRVGGEVLLKADRAMERRGWYRVVGVQEGMELVAVYMPSRMDSSKELSACVLVMEEHQMVVVSASCNPAPLMGLVEKAWEEEGARDWTWARVR